MKNFKKITLVSNASIKDAIDNLQKSGKQILLVTRNDKFFGTITDGDIRRGILKGYKLKDTIKKIVNKNPITCNQSVSDKTLRKIMIENKIDAVPILDNNKNFINLKLINEVENEKTIKISNPLVVMMGGMGKRLMPYTKFIPKSLLKLSGKPIVIHIIERAKQNGFHNFYLSINHLGTLIKKTIKKKKLSGLNIKFIEEKKKLDTAGSLSLMKRDLKRDFIVVNGDVITNINYQDILQFHLKNRSIATMAVKQYEFKNPYGEVKIKKDQILDFIEKPTYTTYVNAGVYVFNIKILKFLKYNKKITMLELFQKIKLNKHKILAYPIHENWIDIGTPDKYFLAKKIISE